MHPILNRLDLRDGSAVYVNHPVDDRVDFHDHDFLEVAVVAGGGGVHAGIHGERAVAQGDVIVLHPGQWHGYERCTGMDLRNLCIPVAAFAHDLAWIARDACTAPLVPPPVAPAVPPQEVLHLHLPGDDLAAVVGAIVRLEALAARGAPLLARAESVALAGLVLARLGSRLPHRGRRAATDGPVEALAARMADDLARPWKLADLARRAGLTREHLCRAFRARHGLAPMAWLTRRRAERAAVLLLTTDEPVAQIGRLVGWADANHFARRFRAVLGHAPAAYRARTPGVVRG